MILELYAFLIAVSIVLVILGLFVSEHSGLALIGFALIFILSIVIQTGNLEIGNGLNMSTSFSYVNGSIDSSTQEVVYEFENWDDGTAHQIGFWLAVASAVAFFLMLYNIKRGFKNEE